MDNRPLVSVLMTAYNREKYICEAIDSVLNSTYENFELLLVDDGSTDKTVDLARKYELKDNRVTIHVNNENLGQFPNRNQAAKFAQGEYIMYVDSDDKIKPDAIEYLIKNFSQFPGASYSMIYYHDDIKEPTVIASSEAIRKHFFKNWFLNVGPGGTMIKRNFFNTIGGFSTIYGPASDMFFNLKAVANSDILLLPYPYLIYRRHEGQEINNAYQYLCFNHRYIKDAMQLEEIKLSEKEKLQVIKNSAKGTAKDMLRYLWNSRNLPKTLEAFKKSGIRIKDLI